MVVVWVFSIVCKAGADSEMRTAVFVSLAHIWRWNLGDWL